MDSDEEKEADRTTEAEFNRSPAPIDAHRLVGEYLNEIAAQAQAPSRELTPQEH